MNKSPLTSRKYLLAILSFCLCLGLPANAQQTPGAVGGRTTPTRAAGTAGANVTPRQYPNSGTIGDAYFSIDPETRRIVYIADEATAQYIAQVLTNLDRPKPQVLIKVVFVEVTHNDASDIGIEGGFGKSGMSGTIQDASAVNGFGLSGLSSVVGTNLNTFGQPISSFSAVSPMTQYGAGLYQIAGQDYQVTIRAIAQAGKAKVLSRPSILARNNQPATITVGQNYPYVSSISYAGANSSIPISSVAYRDVGVILKVTPFITADGLVEMIVSPQISTVDPTTQVTISQGVSANAINVRSADTVAVTADGQTIIIGGLMSTANAVADTKIPVLGDLPLFGPLFRRRQKSDTRTELVIFLTPHIVYNPTELAALSSMERGKADAMKTLSDKELDQFLDTLPMKDSTPPARNSNGKNK